MTQPIPLPIPLKVGQVWMLRQQRWRVRVLGIKGNQFTVQYYVDSGLYNGSVVSRKISDWNGTGYPNANADDERDMVTLLYDPEDQHDR